MDFYIKNDEYYRKGTLAQYLDTRAISYGEPGVADLPKTINPFELIIKGTAGENLAFIVLDQSAFNEPFPLEVLNTVLKYCVPRERVVVPFIRLSTINDTISRAQMSASFDVVGELEDSGADSISSSSMSEHFTITPIGGTVCE